jgi:predicted RNA binding protein YcfA (HicA-like mRNA interferase family)
MRSVSGKELIKTLERHGWTLLRVQGSHHIYGKAVVILGSPFRFTGVRLLKPDCCVTL